MKRLAFVIAGLLVPLTSVESGADPGHERRRITVMRWMDEPVTANEPGREGKGDVRRGDPDHQGARKGSESPIALMRPAPGTH